MMVEHNIDVWCPTVRSTSEGNWHQEARPGGRFPKQAFEYISERDFYRCPGECEHVYERSTTDTFHHRYRIYRGRRCGDCSLRERCTESKYGRPPKRDEGEELKEALAQVLS